MAQKNAKVSISSLFKVLTNFLRLAIAQPHPTLIKPAVELRNAPRIHSVEPQLRVVLGHPLGTNKFIPWTSSGPKRLKRPPCEVWDLNDNNWSFEDLVVEVLGR